MKLLHLDSSIMGEGSASRVISAAVVERLRETDPSVEVTYRDLTAQPIAHMTLDAFSRWRPAKTCSNSSKPTSS
jgi:FMN-dependent NADH-azoreductase